MSARTSGKFRSVRSYWSNLISLSRAPFARDAAYIDKIGETRQQLYDLILAANYMDIKSLLHLGCAKVASLIKGQPLEKIKEILDQNQSKKDGDKATTHPSASPPCPRPCSAPHPFALRCERLSTDRRLSRLG